MSTTATGITLDLEGPLPVARRHSLLATEGVVKDDGNDRWMNGVRVVGYPDGVPSRWEPCTTGTTRVKDDSVGDGFPGSRFEPIAVYFPVACSTHGMSNSAVENLITRTEQVLDATLSYGVEQSLVGGTPFSVNPFIGDSNMTALASSAAVSPRIGLSYLEDAIGWLHALGWYLVRRRSRASPVSPPPRRGRSRRAPSRFVCRRRSGRRSTSPWTGSRTTS